MTRPLALSLSLFAALLLGTGLSACDDEGGGGDDPSSGEDLGAPVDLSEGRDQGQEAEDLGPADLEIDLGTPDQGSPDLGSPDLGPEDLGPPSPLARYCGDRDPLQESQPKVLGETSGELLGVHQDLPAGTLSFVKLVPQHPFLLSSLRVSFGGGSGSARLRLTPAWGRSYPTLEEGADLIPPVELELEDPDATQWQEVDLSEQELLLEPTRHYVVVHELSAQGGPSLGVAALGEGQSSRSMLILPGEATPYGVDGDFRVELVGQEVCAQQPEARWFQEVLDTPFRELSSQRAAFTDLNGDGHDDLILNAKGPRAFLGDGAGGFQLPETEPFPDSLQATMLVFGDLDNDGDEDAFAASYVGADGDGDGVMIFEGDCDDASPDVYPGHEEVPGNGLDDDCDRVADEGLSEADEDGDGVSVAEGDCDDTQASVFPEAPELLDARDNDCDGEADEDHVNRILLNDGSGVLRARPDTGVEVLDPSAAAALGDVDGDGVLDLYWGNWLVTYPQPAAMPDRFFFGQGDGGFREATEEARLVPDMGPAACYGVLFADVDDDGLQDIWVGNYGYGLNFLWRNQGDGTFRERGYEMGLARDGEGIQGGNTFGGDFGDFDNDGDLDLYAANIAHPRYQPWSDPSTMLVNGGPPDYHFEERRAELGMAYDEGDVNAAFADYDNDGDLDLLVLSLYTGNYSRLYRNDGAWGFTDVTYEAGLAVHDSVSGVWSDVDEDGDLDLVIADRSRAPWVQLYLNQTDPARGWVELILEGRDSNRDGVGAKVVLRAGGVEQQRHVRGGGGHSNTQHSRVVHFGLGEQGQIDELSVRWVGGSQEVFEGVAPRGRYRLVEGSGLAELIPR